MESTVKPCTDAYNAKPNKRNPGWIRYRKEVWRLTEQIAHQIPGIEKRGFTDHHIDHKYSIWQGFLNKIDPKTIANISNLCMLPYLDNMKKGVKCSDKSCLHSVEQVD